MFFAISGLALFKVPVLKGKSLLFVVLQKLSQPSGSQNEPLICLEQEKLQSPDHQLCSLEHISPIMISR